MKRTLGILALLAVFAVPLAGFADGGGVPELKALETKVIKIGNKVFTDMEYLARQGPIKWDAANLRISRSILMDMQKEVLVILADESAPLSFRKKRAEGFMEFLEGFNAANEKLLNMLNKINAGQTS